MIDEIKRIVQNYINNLKLCQIMTGIVVEDGIKVNEKLIIPYELIHGNLKKFIIKGDKVRLLRNHGGQEFYIIEILDKEFVFKDSVISLSMNSITTEYKVEDVKK